MQWYKINLSSGQIQSGDSLKVIEQFWAELELNKNIQTNDIALFTKVAHDGSLNLYFTHEAYKYLQDLIKEYNPIKCLQPTKKPDKEGSFLTYRFGNPDLLSE